MQQTTNFGLQKPEPLIDNVDINVINNNMNIIDEEIANRAPSDHGHTVADITDFPASMPASGGNADTVDDKHASDFVNAIAVYSDTSQIDPNTTQYSLILTNHPNAPKTGLWYIHTLFYSTKTTGRAQIAMSYNAVETIYIRYFYNNVWSSWAPMAKESHTQAASTITGGTLAGTITANASAVSVLTTAQVRNIKASTTDLTAGSSALTTGELYIVYE
ncbi:MAG: hypothetical protein K0R92_2831 [Lachnospiraceae bacterium]|jgi:hypothetical protein|nr:hypothetical protein [Lachnospiraceae bacterium]